MSPEKTEKEYTKEDIVKAFLSINANILINLYTNENVLFGRINPNDKVPVKLYLEDLGFHNIDKFLDSLFSDGHNIENGFVIDRNFNERCFELYREKIECVFYNTPIDKSSEEDDNDIYHFKYGIYDYLKSVYPMFREIISTEIEPDFFASTPDILDLAERRAYYLQLTKFVVAIKMKKLRQGGCVDRYVKTLPFISPILRRLLKKQKGRYLLKNNDTDSLDYKLALLSCFSFYNAENAKLFELKMLRWEELRSL